MSPTVLFALFILTCDFILFALFRWTYPDRSRNSPRRARLRKPGAPGYALRRAARLR